MNGIILKLICWIRENGSEWFWYVNEDHTPADGTDRGTLEMPVSQWTYVYGSDKEDERC